MPTIFLVKSQSAARRFSHLTNFSYCFAGAILNSSMLAASAVHPASETAQIKGRLEVHLEMNTDKHEMTMGLFIKACINATCLFRKKVFDATTIPGKNSNLLVTSKKRKHQFTNLKCCKMSFKAFKMKRQG